MTVMASRVQLLILYIINLLRLLQVTGSLSTLTSMMGAVPE